MIDERAGKIVPIPVPIGEFNKGKGGKQNPRLGPGIAKGETVDVCDISPARARLWSAKIVGFGSKEIVLDGDPGGAIMHHGMMVLLKGHPFLLHGHSDDRRQVVLRCLPKKAARRYLETPEYDRDALLALLAKENQPPPSEAAQVKELLTELEQAAAESKAVGEAKALLDLALAGNDPGGLVREEIALRALTEAVGETTGGMDLSTSPDITVVYVQHECGGTLEIPLSALEEMASGTWGTIPCPKCKARLNELIIAEWDKHEKVKKEADHGERVGPIPPDAAL